MYEELSGQIKLGFIVLGHYQQAGRVLVDPVYEYPHPLVLGIRSLADSQMIGQCVYQRAREMSVARMHDHPCRLV